MCLDIILKLWTLSFPTMLIQLVQSWFFPTIAFIWIITPCWGPIDPQSPNSEGRLVAVAGYLHEYNELIKKSREGNLTDAELFFLVKNFDPVDMFSVKQATEPSKKFNKKSLVEYKFKDWTKTQTTGKKVTTRMRQERAENIARVLGDPLKWHSHGRGITMQELHSEEIRLIIDDYGEDEKLSKNIHQYYDLLKDYCRKMDVQLALHPANDSLN